MFSDVPYKTSLVLNQYPPLTVLLRAVDVFERSDPYLKTY